MGPIMCAVTVDLLPFSSIFLYFPFSFSLRHRIYNHISKMYHSNGNGWYHSKWVFTLLLMRTEQITANGGHCSCLSKFFWTCGKNSFRWISMERDEMFVTHLVAQRTLLCVFCSAQLCAAALSITHLGVSERDTLPNWRRQSIHIYILPHPISIEPQAKKFILEDTFPVLRIKQNTISIFLE